MVFSSIEFIFFFLPILLFFFFIIDKKYTKYLLLVASLFFYFFSDSNSLILLLSLIFLAYVFGIIFDYYRESKIKKIFLFFVSFLLIGILFLYKYNVFVSKNLQLFFSFQMKNDKLIIPLGISFYIFQILSYLIDVYRGEKAQRNLISLALYISFFPQLISGPIVRYNDIKKDLNRKKYSFDIHNIENGLWRFFIGLCKKVIFADNLGVLTNIVFSSKSVSSFSILFAWLGAISFALQIYYDFSGYSDMAIGLAEMFGFHLKENFRYPYAAKTIREFFRRWHISLYHFFRDYVYIPLGGNKCSRLRNAFNILFVWLLTGIWHGASWNFVLWGLFFGIIILIESRIHYDEKNSFFSILHRFLTIMIILLLWVLFRADNLTLAFQYILSMFGVGTDGFVDKAFLFQFSNYGFLLGLSIFFALPIFSNIWEKYSNSIVFQLLCSVFLIFGVLVSISYIIMDNYNPFLYYFF